MLICLLRQPERFPQGRLGVFYKDLPIREYKFLLGNDKHMSKTELQELLSHRSLRQFDPVAEAFKVKPRDTSPSSVRQCHRSTIPRIPDL